MQEPESKHTGAVCNSAAVYPDWYSIPQAIALLLVRIVCSSAIAALARAVFAGTTCVHDKNASAGFTLLSLFAVDEPMLVSLLAAALQVCSSECATICWHTAVTASLHTSQPVCCSTGVKLQVSCQVTSSSAVFCSSMTHSWLAFVLLQCNAMQCNAMQCSTLVDCLQCYLQA